MADSPRPSALWLVLAIVAALAAVVAVGFSFLATAFACFGDTAECTRGEPPREFRGRLFDYEGRPAPDTPLVFGSGLYRDQRASIRTDEQGRFCFRAYEGNTIASVTVEGQMFASQHIVRSNAPVDPRLADPAVRDSLRKRDFPGDRTGFMTIAPGPPYFSPSGASEARELWRPSDAAPACPEVSANVAWHRSDDPVRSWQFIVLMLAPALTIALVVLGLWRYARARRTASPWKADRTLQVACLAAVATVALTIAIWSLG